MSNHRTTKLSGKVEWYTPPGLLEAVRHGMGGPFDIDPASNAAANELVRAARYYTKKDDALGRPWFLKAGERLWHNPPYARGLMTRFAHQWAQEVVRFEGTQAAILVNADTGTSWFHELVGAADLMFLFKQRIAFYNPDTRDIQRGGSLPQALFYSGPFPAWMHAALHDYNAGHAFVPRPLE